MSPATSRAQSAPRPRDLDDATLARKARALRFVLFDVDGVLTDGRVWFTAEGETIKPFHAHDGLAMKLAQRCDLRIGLLTGRSSEPLFRRAKDLGLEPVIAGSWDKAKDFAQFLKDFDLEPAEVAYVGDDVPDLPVLRRCGLALAPADASPEVLEVVHRELHKAGGRGAAREALELILNARDQWRPMIEEMFGD
ncbi:MAG: HAD family hydrolase [Acidobacteriota bacterium]